MPVKTDIIGGHASYVAGLGVLDLDNPERNQEMFSKWAGSVKDYPQVIKQKAGKCHILYFVWKLLPSPYYHKNKFFFTSQLRPLYELVKEVPCAGLKRLHLKRALEEYLEEQSSCRHCRTCQNNGMPVLSDKVCTCVCRPDTSGAACQIGHVLGEQPGVANCLTYDHMLD